VIFVADRGCCALQAATLSTRGGVGTRMAADINGKATAPGSKTQNLGR